MSVQAARSTNASAPIATRSRAVAVRKRARPGSHAGIETAESKRGQHKAPVAPTWRFRRRSGDGEQPVQGHGRQHHQRQLRRVPEADLAVGQQRGDRHRDERRDQDQDRHAPAAQQHEPVDPERDQDEVDRGAELLDPGPPALGHGERLPEPPGAREAGSQHQGQATEVVARVARSAVARLVQLLGLVAAAVEGRAGVLPGADPLAVVGHVAVGAGQRLPALGRDQHGPVEGRPVAHRPGHQHDRERGAHGSGGLQATRPAQYGHQQQREHQQRLGAGEGGHAEQDPQHHGSPEAGSVEQPIGGQHRERGEHAVGRLGHHRAVGSDEDRVERGHPGGQQPGPGAGQPPSEQAQRRDRAAAGEQADEPAVATAQPELVEPSHEDGEQRRALRRGQHQVVAVELRRPHEALAVGDQLGERRVVGLVVEDPGRPGGHEQRLERSQADADRHYRGEPEAELLSQSQTFQGAPPAAQMSFNRTASL